ncbi:MAG: HAMP domain-containing histidine kinase [Lachnospiraceae bacterium]|nr:HAMP domain-containing histidine kinase [Lachnospiraceae bacterium]
MKSIFSKTFLSSMLLTLAVVCISFVCVYLLMPRLYVSYKEEQLADDAAAVKELGGSSFEEIRQFAVARADERGYHLNIYDRNGETLVSHGLQTVTSFTVEAETDIGEDGDSGASVTVRDADGGSSSEASFEVEVSVITGDCTVTDADGEELLVVFEASLEPVDEAVSVVLRLLPIVLAISVLLAALASWLHARRITGPVRSIQRSVEEMKMLDRSAVCSCDSKDEIGKLSAGINELYSRLLRAIDDLREEYDDKTASDKEKIDLMLAVSHEIKTPLTSVRGMLECMQYDVGVYRDHETYLGECVGKIDEMTQLLNETLSASKLGLSGIKTEDEVDIEKLVSELVSEYELIAMKRGVSFETEGLAGARLTTSAELFGKALSNVVSNAVKYSREGGKVRIYVTAGRLVVENVCVPLKKEEADSMFLPFVRGEGSSEGGHGLGLYITDRILRVCGVDYSFEPFEEGMRFCISL